LLPEDDEEAEANADVATDCLEVAVLGRDRSEERGEPLSASTRASKLRELRRSTSCAGSGSSPRTRAAFFSAGDLLSL